MSGATGRLRSNLIYDFRFGYNNQGFNFQRETPQTLLPAAGYAIALARSLLAQPGTNNGTLPRELATTKEWQFNNSLNWVKRSHLLTGGVNYQHVNLYHYRLTQGSSIAAPIAQITSTGLYNQVSAAARLPTCSASLTTCCIRSSDLSNYNALWAMTVGQWDSTSFFNSRSPSGAEIAKP